MPLKCFAGWPQSWITWEQNFLSVHRIIVFAVFKILSEAFSDLKMPVTTDSHIAKIE